MAPGEQTRAYGTVDGRPSVRVVVGKAGCGQAGTAVDVGGRPGRLCKLIAYPRGPEVCVPLTGGGSLRVSLGGTSDPVRDEIRVNASVRTGRRDQVAVPVSVQSGVRTVSVTAGDPGVSPWYGGITTDDTYSWLGR